LPFNIDISDVVIPEFCPILGMRITSGEKGFHNASPSLDKRDPIKGYVKGNVAVISFRANLLKRDGTIAEFERILAYMKQL
jgi:hypothetical protein